MKQTFDNLAEIIQSQDNFGLREPGITHPDLSSFIRLRNNGDIEIVAGDNLAIVLNPRSGSINLVADHIKFITRHEGGLRWNRVAFNDRATTFNEPTFIAIDDTKEIDGNLYQDVSYFAKTEKKDPSTGAQAALRDEVKRRSKGEGDE